MDTAEALTQSYKFYRELPDDYIPEELDADWVAESSETICNLTLALMHELDPQVYLDCVAWDAGREELPTETPMTESK